MANISFFTTGSQHTNAKKGHGHDKRKNPFHFSITPLSCGHYNSNRCSIIKSKGRTIISTLREGTKFPPLLLDAHLKLVNRTRCIWSINVCQEPIIVEGYLQEGIVCKCQFDHSLILRWADGHNLAVVKATAFPIPPQGTPFLRHVRPFAGEVHRILPQRRPGRPL